MAGMHDTYLAILKKGGIKFIDGGGHWCVVGLSFRGLVLG